MPTHRKLHSLLTCLCLVLLLAACTPGASTPDATEIALAVKTAQAGTATAEAEESNRIATGIAATLTAQPTATPTDTAIPTNTFTPTFTHVPTKTRTPAPTATITPTRGPTRPPVTSTPTPAPTSASIYGFTGGAEGYVTDIVCSRPAGKCEPVMPPGDISFRLIILSGPDTPWTLFVKYGLSVERDGVNVADMFMFVDAGWLPPDSGVEFGASRNFAVPGRYVIRSSGCLINSDTQIQCLWSTMTGTTVTFTIQP
jgi:hypothetical protein